MAKDMPKMGPKEVQEEFLRLGIEPEDEIPARPSDAERAIGGESIGGTTAANAQV